MKSQAAAVCGLGMKNRIKRCKIHPGDVKSIYIEGSAINARSKK